jgi:hypothetical protein
MRNAGLMFTVFGMALIVAEAVRQLDAAFVELEVDATRPRLHPAAGADRSPSPVATEAQL